MSIRSKPAYVPFRLVAGCAMMAVIGLAGCTSVADISNREPVADGLSYQSQYRSQNFLREPTNESNCNEDSAIDGAKSPISRVAPDIERLSAGDLLEIMVGSDEMLSRSYKVSQDGTLKLPQLKPVRAAGQTVEAVETAIMNSLVEAQLYQTPPSVSVRVTDAAGARVFVSGAVFEPGAVVIGSVGGKDVDVARQKAMGWVADGRRLSRALQSAGGVRPDADLSRVAIRRGSSKMILDVRPALSGHPFSDMIMLTGDQVEVPSRGCFQAKLMVPSTITAPGVKIFMSNLTQPAASNAVSAIGKETQELRYGTRFIQAIIGMNCVGGIRATNADRSAVLFTRNPMTGESIVVSRRIEDLVQRQDRDDYNPYILPGDALACYDSVQTSLIAVSQVFNTVASSASLLRH